MSPETARSQVVVAAAPDWFIQAVAVVPGRRVFEVDGAAIELLTWGRADRPGLLFLHGNGAHANWWRFIAPFFIDQWSVAALSFSGMGDSDWRKAYSVDLFARETAMAAEVAGLLHPGRPLSIVAHSFGSVVGLQSLEALGDNVQQIIIADNGVRPSPGNAPTKATGRPHQLYRSREDILLRFRLRPEQPCANTYLLRDVAKHSVRQVQRAGGEVGWSWKFDPCLKDTLGDNHSAGFRRGVERRRARMAFVWGADSVLMPQETIARTRQICAPDSRFVKLASAGHHLMLDQPLAFVETVRMLLETG